MRPTARPRRGAAHLALDIDALGHAKRRSRVARGASAFDEDVVLVVTALVGDLEDVAEALGGDQRRAGALALDDGVGGKRRAVEEDVDLAKAEASLAQDPRRAFDDRSLGSLRRGENLGGEELPRSLQNDVGKRATDVGSDAHGRLGGGHVSAAFRRFTGDARSGAKPRLSWRCLPRRGIGVAGSGTG